MRKLSLFDHITGLSALLRRDMVMAIRSGAQWQMGLIFFVLFLLLSAIALGGNFSTLRPLALSLVWMALVLSLMLSFDQIFTSDFEDDTIIHLRHSGFPIGYYVAAKILSQWVFSILPLLLCLPITGLLFDLSFQLCAGLFFSILIASPALLCYGAFNSACLVGQKNSGILLVTLSLPVLLPVLIFGIQSALQYEQHGLYASEFQALAGLSLIAIAIGFPATRLALLTNLEQ